MATDRWHRTLLKGFIMGLCDVVPGVSGGTIAFITGIYERLLNAIASTFALIKNCFSWLVRKQDAASLRKAYKQADLPFLGILFIGILLAFIIGSRGVLYLLDQHFALTISFFIGLIAASALSITKHLEERSLANTATLIIGLAIGASFYLYAPVAITPSLPYLFMSGFLAVAALFLPGISGSFILLILGVYEYLLALLHDVTNRPGELLMFILGALLGAYAISKAVQWLFVKNKSRTLYGLLGLLIGSLSVPIKRLIIAGIPNAFLAAAFAIAGFLLVLLIERMAP